MANLEISRRGLPRRDYMSSLESKVGEALIAQHPQLVEYITSLRAPPFTSDGGMAAEEWTNTRRYGMERSNKVDIEESDIESEDSDTLLQDLPEEDRAEMQLLAKELAKWATKGAKFIGDAFGQRGLEDALLGNICFDEDNKCYEVVTDENGLQVIHDLTQGLRMAQKSGMDERQSLAAIFTKCARCGVGMPTGGDKALLKSRDGPTATYWCKKCAMEDHFEKTGIPLTTRQFRIKSATAAGRPFLTSQGIEKSALFKLTMGTFGTAGKEAVANMKKHIAAGLDKEALEKFHKHVKMTVEASTQGRGMLEYAAAHDFNPMISKAFAMRYACRQQGCGVVPKSEAGWIIAQQCEGDKNEYGFCGACGGEYKHAVVGCAGGFEGPGQAVPVRYLLGGAMGQGAHYALRKVGGTR